MSSFTTYQILMLGDVKEAQVKAFLSYYYNTLGDEHINEIQERTTNYAQTLADSFMKEHQNYFDSRKNRIEFYESMRGMRADKPHSGHRFWEQLYKSVIALEQTNEK